jgi:predicted MFS family arabinose efflux permease
VSYLRVSHLVTLTNAGMAAGIICICPLGDTRRTRPIFLALVALCALCNLALALCRNFEAFCFLTFTLGFCSAGLQASIPAVAALSKSNERATSIAYVLTGLYVGTSLSRVLSGIINQHASWRITYGLVAGLQAILAVSIWAFYPDVEAHPSPDCPTYFAILRSLFALPFTEPVGLLLPLMSTLTSAAYSSFWTTLTFLLSAPPYTLSTSDIGLIALILLSALFFAPLCGRLADRTSLWLLSVLAILTMLIAHIIYLFTAQKSLAAVLIVALLLDWGHQMVHGANETALQSVAFGLGSRLVRSSPQQH